MGKTTLILLIGFVATASTKPYEANRRSSSPSEYRFQPYGDAELSDQYLDRLLADRSKDGEALDDQLYQSLADELLHDQPNAELQDREEPVSKPAPNAGIEADNEKPLKDQSNSEDKEAKDQPSDGQQEQSPEEKAKSPNREDEASKTDSEQQKLKEDSPKHMKHRQPEQSHVPRSHSGSQQGEKPSPLGHPRRDRPVSLSGEGAARGPGPNGSAGSEPPLRQPQAPLVQINVNVASPAL